LGPLISMASVLIFSARFFIYRVNLVGEEYVGLGSDFDGLGNSLPNQLKDTSTYVNLIEGLLRRKHSKKTIEKICYKNFFRVWEANLRNHQT